MIYKATRWVSRHKIALSVISVFVFLWHLATVLATNTLLFRPVRDLTVDELEKTLTGIWMMDAQSFVFYRDNLGYTNDLDMCEHYVALQTNHLAIVHCRREYCGRLSWVLKNSHDYNERYYAEKIVPQWQNFVEDGICLRGYAGKWKVRSWDDFKREDGLKWLVYPEAKFTWCVNIGGGPEESLDGLNLFVGRDCLGIYLAVLTDDENSVQDEMLRMRKIKSFNFEKQNLLRP